MVSESQTCKEESRNELKKRKKYECGHYCQNRAYILCPQLYCHRASVASTAGVTASYIMTNTRDDSCYITTNAKSKLSTAVNGIAGEHSPSAGDVLQANQLVWVFHGSCSSWQWKLCPRQHPSFPGFSNHLRLVTTEVFFFYCVAVALNKPFRQLNPQVWIMVRKSYESIEKEACFTIISLPYFNMVTKRQESNSPTSGCRLLKQDVHELDLAADRASRRELAWSATTFLF